MAVSSPVPSHGNNFSVLRPAFLSADPAGKKNVARVVRPASFRYFVKNRLTAVLPDVISIVVEIRKRVRMDQDQAVAALGALAQETRLALFRLLVTQGPRGLPAGAIAERLGVAPSSLSFHLQQLLHAGLVTQRRFGRQLIYAAEYDTMNALLAYLTANCCGRGEGCV